MPDDCARPADAVDPSCFAAGAAICTEGEPGDVMYVIVAGSAAVSSTAAGRLAVLSTGEFFGEMAIVDAGPRSATVTALEDGTRVLAIDRARFVHLVSHQPAFSLAVMATLSHRLRGIGSPVQVAGESSQRNYGADEVRPGLWFLRAPGRASNVVAICGRDRTVLVDAGLPSTLPSLDWGMRELGRSLREVDLVVLTHEHADHVGGVPGLPGTPVVAAHVLAANKLALRDDFATVNTVIGEAVGPVRVDLCLPEGTIIDVAPYRFEVLHTPGHTSGSICLADQGAGVLIGGDCFVAGGGIGGIFGSGNVSDYVLSLQRLQRLRIPLALPGHGRAATDAGTDIAGALGRAHGLLRDTREIFAAMDGKPAFDRIMRAIRDLNR